MTKMTVPKKVGRPEGTTNTAFKIFQYAMSEAFIDGDKDDPRNFRHSARKLLYDLIKERNPAVIKKFVEHHVDVENVIKNQAITAKIRLEITALEERHAQESRIRELDIALKEKELNAEKPVETSNETLQELMNKMLTLDKSTGKKLRAIHAKKREDEA